MVHEELLKAVREQMASSDTPYVKKTHIYLVSEQSIEADEAVEMIAHCLADEIDSMTSEERDFDANRYQLLLSLLPTLPEA